MGVVVGGSAYRHAPKLLGAPRDEPAAPTIRRVASLRPPMRRAAATYLLENMTFADGHTVSNTPDLF